ncbi:MAG: CAP domain-containing protein [Candidatus Sulfotelmatobacter sp.]
MRLVIRTAAWLILGLSAILTVQAQSGATPAEQQLFASVNQARRNAQLPALKWNDALATAAKRHAGVMAQRGEAQHGFAGEPALASRVTQAGARFVWLSENVALGSRVEAIEAEFFRSPNHRANILDSDMDSVGVGIVERGGQLFAVEDFSKAK